MDVRRNQSQIGQLKAPWDTGGLVVYIDLLYNGMAVFMYCKLGNIRWGFIFANIWSDANSTPRELLLNYTHYTYIKLHILGTLTHGIYELSDSEFKTLQINPILKSVKIWPIENKALYRLLSSEMFHCVYIVISSDTVILKKNVVIYCLFHSAHWRYLDLPS